MLWAKKSSTLILTFGLLIKNALQHEGDHLEEALQNYDEITKTLKDAAAVLEDYVKQEEERLLRFKRIMESYTLRQSAMKASTRYNGSHLNNDGRALHPVASYRLLRQAIASWQLVTKTLESEISPEARRSSGPRDLLKLNPVPQPSLKLPYDLMEWWPLRLVAKPQPKAPPRENHDSEPVPPLRDADVPTKAQHRLPDISKFALTSEDLVQASNTVVELQEVYRLSAKDVAEGVLLSPNPAHGEEQQESSEILSAPGVDDCLYLAKAAARKRWNALAADWFNQTRIKLQKKLPVLSSANPKRLAKQLANYANSSASQEAEIEPDAEQKLVNQLCRGEKPMFSLKDPDSKLLCQYSAATAFARLAPIRTETVYTSPDITVLRNVLSKKECAILRELAREKLMRSPVVDKLTGEYIRNDVRTSKSAWLKETLDPVVQHLRQRAEAATGLTREGFEVLQVAQYGLGGKYDAHFDFFSLNEPIAGGATVFPELDLTIWPQEGDAVFWHNLYRNGTMDEQTLHAGCPVLFGEKWIANQWVGEGGQEFRRPCSKDPLE